MNQRLIESQTWTPVEFQRRPQSLSDLHHWKSSELRQVNDG